MIRGRRSVVTAVALLIMVGVILFMSQAGDDTVNVNAVQLEKYDQKPIKADSNKINLKEDTDNEYTRKPKVSNDDDYTRKPKASKDSLDINFELEFTDTPFMPKMANETLKAQLGNSAWRLFHTILARYPAKPTQLEKTTLDQYIKLFAQVYPCGDCARHFQELLKKYPPQVSSRQNAAMWGCMIHNKVNDSLKKPIYDCTTILEDYDCGCAKDEEEEETSHKKVDVEEEGLQRGG